jgi:flagellar biosynthesis protein
MSEEKRAFALRYDASAPAPVLIARGRAELAERIVRLARENGIEIVRDDWLSDALLVCDVGEMVPERCFAALAAVFAWLAGRNEQ